MLQSISTGCSGFYNRHWQGVFYPENLPQSKWFEYYAQQLPALELNVTFYKFPTASGLKKWYEKSPPNFKFAVKAPRAITHFKKLIDCEKIMQDFYTACAEGLREKLSCVLFQFPPSFRHNTQNLELIIQHLNPAYVNVVEFRDASWWNETVYEKLRLHHIIFCSISHPTLPQELVITNSTAYCRIHGRPKLFYSPFNIHEQMEVYQSVLTNRSIQQAFIFFNNTAGIEGILNALEFQWLVKTGDE
jgi:uncharacterized protein YecE (DUF72 family)